MTVITGSVVAQREECYQTPGVFPLIIYHPSSRPNTPELVNSNKSTASHAMTVGYLHHSSGKENSVTRFQRGESISKGKQPGGKSTGVHRRDQVPSMEMVNIC